MNIRPFFLLPILLAAVLAGGPATARTTSVVELLDRYAAGGFEAVERELAGDIDFDSLLAHFRRHVPAWIVAGGLDARGRRHLVAATVALETARAGLSRDWKWTIRQPLMCAAVVASAGPQLPVPGAPPNCYQPLNVLSWKPAPLLIEWGCELLRGEASPRPVERWWQLAALSVAQRAEDPQFLVGDIQIGQGMAAGEVGNLQHEIKHLDHVVQRFPSEMRFRLAQGIARDRDWHDDATQAYRALENDPDVGGEAMMRLGAMQLRQGRPEEGLKSFERADTLTRDPYVVFLTRYFRGQALERQDLGREAEAAYRGAVAAVPHAQSATVALAALLSRDGRRAEAHRLVEDMLAADPRPADPWRAFVHADDRFWPQLVGKLRAEIVK